MPYIGRGPVKNGAFQILDDVSGSFNGSTTSFALTVGSVALIAGAPETLTIAVDGVMQEPGTAYTISGSNIVFGSPPAAESSFWGVELGDVGGLVATSTTQSVGDNSTNVATTAFVTSAVATENEISEMNDVTLSGIGSGEVLKWNGSAWINNNLAELGVAALSGAAFTGAITGVTALTVDNLNIDGNTLLANSGAVNITPAAGSAIVLDGAVNVDAGVVTGVTSFTVDNVNIDGNTLSSTAGTDLFITPLSGQQLILDGLIVIDNGVVTGATSITSTQFVGGGAGITALAAANITASGTLPALNGAALTALSAANITASGTLPALNGAALTALTAANITASGTLPALNGAALTALNGSQVTTGTVADARIAATLSRITATETLTNKSIDLDANTLTGTIGEFNTALQSESFATLGGTETLVAKTLSTPTINAGTLNLMTVLTVANDIDVGAYEVRALKFESDQATGTAPLTVASTTVVTNLNADLLDGVQGALYSQIAATETLAAKTLTTPTISSTGWTNATHAHAANNSGATLSASILGAGTLPAARIATDSIVEGKLNVSNGPTNGYVLTARDGVDGGFTWEVAIADEAVTYAKLQNLGTANRVLGSASTGLIGEVQIATDMIADNAVDGTKIALASQAAGDITYYNGTDWIRLAKGTADEVLTMNNGATAPNWEAASIGGIDLSTIATGGVIAGSGSGTVAIVTTGTDALINAGTDSTVRLWSAANLKAGILTHATTKAAFILGHGFWGGSSV